MSLKDAIREVRALEERAARRSERDALIEQLAAQVHDIAASGTAFPYGALTAYLQQPYRDIAERQFWPLIVEFVAEWITTSVPDYPDDVVGLWREEMGS